MFLILSRLSVLAATISVPLFGQGFLFAGETVLVVDSPMSPPAWALLQRELLRANTDACREFYEKYFDDRGFLLCVERWGGDDGPDDAIENVNDWPILHALGAPDEVLHMYKRAWEGHLRQFTLARTTDVPFARDGMYYKEFPVMFDWLHNGEGLTVFNLQGLSDPRDAKFQQRVRRFAGFYMNEDPQAQNYDSDKKIIRSLFNGSRGPLLRKATAVDWAGDPIEVQHRFRLGHGETNYEQMLAHFQDYNDIVGDHPLNLLATSLALNAFMLTGEQKYRDWLLEYVEAWRQRMVANGNLIPTNIGLDGKIGGETNGKWYGGVYGWAFSVKVPQDGSLAHRNIQFKGFTGFMNAFLLTGDQRFLEPWRQQAEIINSHGKMIDGRRMYPRMHGDQGWYEFQPQRYDYNAVELYYLSMREPDLREILEAPRPDPESKGDSYRRAQSHSADVAWLAYLDGQNPDYPEQALRADLNQIRTRLAAMRLDETTPDTRLADDPMKFNPASVESLVHLMLGGLHPGHQASVLFSRLRYFDPADRRAGLPKDVAALVERLTDDSVVVTLINLSQTTARDVVVQAGSYGEHQFVECLADGHATPLSASHFTARLHPGSGAKLTIYMERYVNRPQLAFPAPLQ